MNRKNTLILAILVNAGIFFLLFILVNRGHQDDQLLTPNSERSMESAHRLPGKEGAILTRRPIDSPIKVLQDARAPGEESEPYLEITVRRGHQLDRLAFGYHVTEEEIIRLNHLTSPHLYPGQVLKIPLPKDAIAEKADASTQAEPESSDESAAVAEDVYYIVKKGDSPWTIAQKHKIKLEELLRINDLDEKKARRLREGDRLKVN